MTVLPRSLLGALSAAVLACGCAMMNPPAAVPIGSGIADATNALGKPTGEYALPGGGKRLEYATGPSGKETWMLDFDTAGKMVSITQVLNDRNFDPVRAGMTTDELLFMLGRPIGRRQLPRTGEVVWSYRYESPACVLFQASVDPATRKVINTGRLPDPVCTPDL